MASKRKQKGRDSSGDSDEVSTFKGSREPRWFSRIFIVISGCVLAQAAHLPIAKGILGPPENVVWYLASAIALFGVWSILRNTPRTPDLLESSRRLQLRRIALACVFAAVVCLLTLCALEHAVWFAVLILLAIIGGVLGRMYPIYDAWSAIRIDGETITLRGPGSRRRVLKSSQLQVIAILDRPSGSDAEGYWIPWYGGPILTARSDFVETRLGLFWGKAVYYLSLTATACGQCVIRL